MMSLNAKAFDVDLQKFADAIQVDIATVTKKVALGMFSDIVHGTPVDTGRARSNWIISIAYSGFEEVATTGSSKAAADAQVSGGAGVLNGYNGKYVIYITNGLPYIERLNEGWSQQAPAGFVDRAIAKNIQPILDTQ